MKTTQEQRSEIENQMTEKGLNFQFSGISTTNGLSIYYNVEGVKYRFSDHSVTNYMRVTEEAHFGLPFYNEINFMKGQAKRIHRNVFTKKQISIITEEI